MRFGLIHRIMTDSLATLGILALVTSGKLHPIAAGVVLLGLLLGILLPERHRQHAVVQVAGVAAPLVVLGIQLFRLVFGADPIPVVVEFAAALQVIRLITRRGAAHDHQVILLSLLHLIAGTVLGGGLTYAVALAGFLVFTPGALVLSHLRREVEGNYRQGARDRTGMPVDVPRILRSRRVVGRGFLLFTCSLSLPVFLFSGLLFTIFPRVGFAWLTVPPISPARMVGFSNSVDLGGVGTIRTDPTLVMRLRTESEEAAEPPLRRNFYLRGAIFDTYNGRSWSRKGLSAYRPVESGNQLLLRRRPRPGDRVFEIDLNRIDPAVVFVPGEAVAIELMNVTLRPRESRALVAADPHGQLQYNVMDQGGIRYKAYLPKKGLIFPEKEHPDLLGRYASVPPNLSPKIADLAREIVGSETDPLEVARKIEQRLREGYRYDLGSPSGAAEDPLEHFLFESKRGHCEFYSTAMAMMLRVVGVPSRNVTGFVGGTYNRFGEFYAVRQGDAHSWVEAYLPERGWIRFDPTPPSSAVPQASTQGVVAFIREIYEAASQSWSKNVLDFDMDSQLGILQNIKEVFKRESTGSLSDLSARFNWRRVLIAVGGAMLIVTVVLIRRRWAPPESIRQRELSVEAEKAAELYRALDRVLAMVQIPRAASTPPLTHAKALVHSGHPFGNEVLALTQIYLAARYGGVSLSESESRRFKERVARLRRAERAQFQAA
jgi:transglutaminase-like putative cysteine protease